MSYKIGDVDKDIEIGCSHCGGFNSTFNEIPHTDGGLGPQSGVHMSMSYKIGDDDKDKKIDDPDIEMRWYYDFGGFGVRGNGDEALDAD